MTGEKYFFANRPIESASQDVTKDILWAREQGYPIPIDPNLAVDKTLETYDLKPYPSPIPDIDQYISARINHSDDHFPGFNYGNFVETPKGDVAFAKLRYGPRNTEKALVDDEMVDVPVGGLLRESQLLNELAAHGYIVPELYGYFPATPEEAQPNPDEADTLEMICIEAIPPDEGSTLPPELWTPDLAKLAASKIRTFAKPISEIELFKDEQTPLPVEILVERARLSSNDEYEQKLGELLESYEYLDEPIVVHGDAWPNNVIVKYDHSDVLFVDWELAGPGYKSQDAGRMLWGLTIDKDWNLSEVGDNAKAFIEEWSKSDDDKSTLNFGVFFESLRWIADRQDKIHSSKTDELTRVELMMQVEAIKAHTLKIVNYTNEV